MEAGEVGGVGGGIRSGCRQYPEIDVGTPELLKCEILKLAYARADNKAINNIYNGVRPADASGKWGGPVSQLLKPPFLSCHSLD